MCYACVLKWLCGARAESVCGLCVGLCLWCVVYVVCGAAWHAEENPCVGSKRLRVSVQNASMCAGKTPAC